jgi:hypothetical protein
MSRKAWIGAGLAAISCAAILALGLETLRPDSERTSAAPTAAKTEARSATKTEALPSPGQPRLLRHFEVRDLGRVGDGEGPQVLEPFDGFVYGHHGTYEDAIATLASRGKTCYRYYNVLTTPLPEWIGGGSPWFDWVDSVVVRQWGATVRQADGRPARFRWFGKPAIIDWSQIGPARGRVIAQKQVELLGAARGLFLDQFWLGPAPWMFDRESGEFQEWPKARAAAWQTNILSYLDHVRALAPGPTLINGADDAPMPICLENAQNDWPASVALWKRHPLNVLSIRVDAPAYQDSLIGLWLGRGGLIAMSGEWAETQPFYARASSARELASPRQ